MSGAPEFTIEVNQNPYLPMGGHEVHAVAHIRASGVPTGVRGSARGAEVIMVDSSGSMDFPSTKLKAAKQATKAAIDTLRDGTLFAVVSGTGMASMVYPFEEGLVPADERTRKEAKREVDKLRARGGTAMGQWLLMARRLLEPHSDAIRHAILLTDGKNESEREQDLAEAIAYCEGVFVCDCRGIGLDWRVDEVRKISTALLGDIGLVSEPADLVADFTKMMENAMGKAVADVALRVRTISNARVKYVKQTYPVIDDLTARRTEVGPNVGDYPTGSWGGESKHYHVCLEVEPDEVNPGGKRRPCQISVVLPDGSGGLELAKAGVFAQWTDDEELSTRINPEVAQVTGRAKLAEAVQEGLELRRGGDEIAATARLVQALQLANEAGDEHTARLLGRVVEIEADGTSRLRNNEEDLMVIDIESHKTARVGPPREG
ncbi:VWA domain-containing protein [Embleya scabrispora]|uniref:VWA domain-containing protein n=1 Tax=Embleya scabrispora TaxID=159449 RepID=UPI00035C5388|nr:VWA domain-containing protein [Embleya scabrispora]MYS84304.1 VWA domain-containing protein [Streptomyces sp. SID5474]